MRLLIVVGALFLSCCCLLVVSASSDSVADDQQSSNGDDTGSPSSPVSEHAAFQRVTQSYSNSAPGEDPVEGQKRIVGGKDGREAEGNRWPFCYNMTDPLSLCSAHREGRLCGSVSFLRLLGRV
jgi:hypothetical protein